MSNSLVSIAIATVVITMSEMAMGHESTRSVDIVVSMSPSSIFGKAPHSFAEEVTRLANGSKSHEYRVV